MEQVWLREDKNDRKKTTAVKCLKCGAKFPPPQAKDNRPAQ